MKKSDSLPIPGKAALRAANLIERLGRLIRSGEHAGGLNPAQWEALRYLARANRFSRTPAGLAAFLGSTRGTVSQTLIALESKGFVEKQQSEIDRRSVGIDLTPAGAKMLASDAVRELANAIEGFADADALAAELDATLRSVLHRRAGRSFGVCHSCRHFQRKGNGGICRLLDEPLSAADADAICVEHEAQSV